MQLFINPAGELSIYRQIMRQITEAIAGGRLKPGDKLPSHRELAEQIVVAPLTVKKAYDELESEGFISTQRGRGTFVAETAPLTDSVDATSQLRAAARNLLAQAYLAGLGMREASAALREAEKDMAQERRLREKENQ
jgi:GntR family transcriptional regulator